MNRELTRKLSEKKRKRILSAKQFEVAKTFSLLLRTKKVNTDDGKLRFKFDCNVKRKVLVLRRRVKWQERIAPMQLEVLFTHSEKNRYGSRHFEITEKPSIFDGRSKTRHELEKRWIPKSAIS